MHNKLMNKICWAMVFILSVTWSGIPQKLAFAQKTARLSEEERKKEVEKLKKLFDALEEAAKEIPRDTFDPRAIVDKVGKDPIKLFEWVRDNTYLVPYRGSLRGYIGVLMDRLGNSLDRALLLHKLLEVAGHKAQLANGVLAESQAKILLEKTRPVPENGVFAGQEASLENVEELIVRLADKYHFKKAEMLRINKKMTLERQRIAEDVAQRVTEQTAIISEAVGVPDKKEQWNELKRATVKAFKDHWWVQWQRGSEWIDMDPAFPEAAPGQTITEDKYVCKPSDIGSENLHLVKIRIVVEQWTEGVLKEHSVLEHTLSPSKLLGKRILLQHFPISWANNSTQTKKKNPKEELKAAVLSIREWIPVLSIGSKRFQKSSFKITGEINNEPRKKGKSRFGGMNRGGRFGSLSRGLLNGVSKDKEKKDSCLTAEWIEYEIHKPGGQPHIVRRKIFDLLGNSQRLETSITKPTLNENAHFDRGLLLMGQTEILPLSCRLSSAFLDYMYATSFIANKDIFTDIIKQVSPAEMLKTFKQETISTFKPLPSVLYVLAIRRHAMVSFSSDVYLYQPNILSYHVNFRPSTHAYKLIISQGLDVVANAVELHPKSRLDPFVTRLGQGVSDCIIETLALSTSDNVESVEQIFVKSREFAIDWFPIRSLEDPILKIIALPQNARIEIERDLADGYHVLVPKKPIPNNDRQIIGWWRVDPLRGDTIAIMEGGHGQSIIEYVIAVIGVIGTAWTIACDTGIIKGDWCNSCLMLFVSLAGAAGIFGMLSWVNKGGIILLSLSIYDMFSALRSFADCFIGPLFK